MLSRLLILFFAFAFPSSGMGRGRDAIYQAAAWRGSPLAQACRAGALCVVVRTPDVDADERTCTQDPTNRLSASEAQAVPSKSAGTDVVNQAIAPVGPSATSQSRS